MLETKNPPGCLRIEASFFSAAFENPSIVSEYMVCALVVGQEGSRKRRANRLISSKDRKSTRLNSSHTVISYAVFCLKKKNCMQDALAHPQKTLATVKRLRDAHNNGTSK